MSFLHIINTFIAYIESIKTSRQQILKLILLKIPKQPNQNTFQSNLLRILLPKKSSHQPEKKRQKKR
jgi:hypothetical protein